MRVLFIASDTKALGGIQQYNRKFIDALRGLDHEVFLIELKNGFFFAGIFFVLESIIKCVLLRPDVTVCAHINYSPIGLFMKKFLGREYVVCTHGVDVWDIKSSLKRWALREAKIITTVAEFTRDKMVAQLPETKDKVYFLYNPIDGNLFLPKSKSKDLIKKYKLEKKKIILTIGRLSAIEGYKGYDRVIKAMPKILEAVPEAVYFLIGDGDDAPRVRKLVSDLDLENKVIMAGAYPNEKLPDFYNLADVFTMPSKAEGAPAVFVEALACGVPVIAGNKDGSTTPLQGGEVGILIDPESINEIAEAVISVLTRKVNKNFLDKDFLRKKTLERFGLDDFPRKVDRMLKLFLTK